jgi:hypothetical protein
MFAYTIDAYAVTAPFADFNFDGRVDSGDYTTWRDHLGLAAGATLDQGDADGDGDVDLADYSIWRGTVGTSDQYEFWKTLLDDSYEGNGAGFASSAVPEPNVLVLLVGGLIGHCFAGRRLGCRPSRVKSK